MPGTKVDATSAAKLTAAAITPARSPRCQAVKAPMMRAAITTTA
jgi:hypothetical protein